MLLVGRPKCPWEHQNFSILVLLVLVSLEDLKLFSDDGLTHMFDNACATDKKSQDELKSSSMLKSLDMENDIHEKTTVAGFVKLEDREKQLIEKERSLLLEAIDAMRKATSLVIFYLKI